MLVLLVAALAVAGLVEASVLRGFTVEQLHDASDLVVSGRVLSVKSVRSGGLIETVARVRVSRTWDGEAARVVRVTVPGGALAGRRLVVPGAPTLARGDELLLFLYADDAGAFRPVGLFQGVWRLDADAPELARASASGGAALVREGSTTIAVDHAERPLTQLVGGVR